MKKSIFGILFGAALAFTLTACKKDPVFEDQITGTWKSTKVTYGQADGTTLFEYTLRLESSKEFELTEKTLTGTKISSGVFGVNADTQEITLTFDDGAAQQKYDITAIGDQSMTAETIISNVRFVIEFKKQ